MGRIICYMISNIQSKECLSMYSDHSLCPLLGLNVFTRRTSQLKYCMVLVQLQMVSNFQNIFCSWLLLILKKRYCFFFLNAWSCIHPLCEFFLIFLFSNRLSVDSVGIYLWDNHTIYNDSFISSFPMFKPLFSPTQCCLRLLIPCLK